MTGQTAAPKPPRSPSPKSAPGVAAARIRRTPAIRTGAPRPPRIYLYRIRIGGIICGVLLLALFGLKALNLTLKAAASTARTQAAPKRYNDNQVFTLAPGEGQSESYTIQGQHTHRLVVTVSEGAVRFAFGKVEVSDDTPEAGLNDLRKRSRIVEKGMPFELSGTINSGQYTYYIQNEDPERKAVVTYRFSAE